MKKAFTLAEVLITLTIIGIVMAISLPVLNNSQPDKDKILYQKAIFNVTSAMSYAMKNQVALQSKKYWADDEVPEESFCEAVSNALKTIEEPTCKDINSSYENPNFSTADGIRYWGFEGQIFSINNTNSVKSRTIYVERTLTKNEEEHLEKLSKDDIHIVYCYNQQCHLATCACRLLSLNDYPCMELEGGFKVWVDDFRYATVNEKK